jgi:hypothetical protein
MEDGKEPMSSKITIFLLRLGNRPRIDGPPPIPVLYEFLYRDIYNAMTRQWMSLPHRIVRRTEKYVYVEQRPYSHENQTGRLKV